MEPVPFSRRSKTSLLLRLDDHRRAKIPLTIIGRRDGPRGGAFFKGGVGLRGKGWDVGMGKVWTVSLEGGRIPCGNTGPFGGTEVG